MTKPLFPLRDAFPWALLTIAAVVSIALVSILQPGLVPTVVVDASSGAMLGIVGLHFWQRWQEVDAWNKAPKLYGEVAVLSKCSIGDLVFICDAPSIVIEKWALYAIVKRGGHWFDRVADAIRGCDITFMPAPWTVNGTLAGGSMEGEHAKVVGPEVDGIERTRNEIIHELSHRALFALGIPVEEHQRIFDEEKLGC